jgi:hypothetical protein
VARLCADLALPMPLGVSLAGGRDASRVPGQLLQALRAPEAAIPLTPSLKVLPSSHILNQLYQPACSTPPCGHAARRGHASTLPVLPMSCHNLPAARWSTLPLACSNEERGASGVDAVVSCMMM